jgi:hypothetical protein
LEETNADTGDVIGVITVTASADLQDCQSKGVIGERGYGKSVCKANIPKDFSKQTNLCIARSCSEREVGREKTDRTDG